MSAYFKSFSSLSISIFFVALSGVFSHARSDGFSGEYLATQRWRDAQSRYSPLTNPAFLTEENYVSVRACDALIMETFNLLETGVTIPVGPYQALGLSYFSENTGKIQGMTWGGLTGDSMVNLPNNWDPSNSNNLVMFSYANSIWKNLSVGANLSVSYQSNFDTLFDSAAISDAIDVGLSYRLNFNPLLGEHLLGLSVQNILPQRDVGKRCYPSGAKFSWLSYFFDRQIEMGLDVSAINAFSFPFSNAAAGPVEYDFSFRAGVWLLRFLNLFLVTGTNYYGFCGGVNFPGANNGRDFSFLYQFLTMTQTEAVTSHSAYIRMQFGRHREDVYAQRSARVAEQTPVELFDQASKLVAEGKYWDAFFVYGGIESQHPSFIDKDWVAYYKAGCMEKLDMRDAALSAYNKVKHDFAKSPVAPRAALGVMRLCYLDRSDSMLAVQFDALTKPEIQDSLKFHADYLMAETLLRQKALARAIALFSKIPETHPDYAFARHSLAIAYGMDNKTDSMKSALGACIETEPRSEAEREISNRSYLFLRLLFYEEKSLSKSVTALRMVQKNSMFYEDAQLALCWAALRARQWNDCLALSQALQKMAQKPSMQCEGALIEGYANLMLKNYKQAFEVLQSAQIKVKNLRPQFADSIKSRRLGFLTARKGYDSLAQEISTLAGVFPSSTILAKIDSLHAVQTAQEALLRDYYSFTDEVKVEGVFSRSAEAIGSDIDYALATAQKLVQQSPKAEIQQKMETKQKELDDQIDKLKNEMNKLNDKK